MLQPIPLGPFELYEPIGRGGMGEVWRGIHRAQQVPVAVKVLTARGMQRSFFLSAFRNEVRAMAGLDHPCIALVFDHGEVSEESADRSPDRLAAGSPYLAMELAHGGSLAPWCGRLAWVEIRDVLVGLLDALAHAHARGVIHRDLKPANVLLGNERDQRPGIKLTDFGLAHLVEAIERPTARGPTAGTPHYMAPEQVHGRRRDYGPWTDLYSLGRVALALVYSTPSPVARQAGARVPVGFDAWVSRLLQREPEERFLRAADAALALMELGDQLDGDDDPSQRQRRLGISAETFALTGVESSQTGRSGLHSPPPHTPGPVEVDSNEQTRRTTRQNSRLPPALDLDQREAALDDLLTEPCPQRVPPVPSIWRRAEPPAAPMRLLGAGLGLYGLRSIPLVDRDSERDTLWATLRAVASEGRARAVLLRGPAGCGKSRLAEWLCERAHEVGAATVIRATHAPLSGPADGVAPGVARLLRCSGLDRRRAAMRVEVFVRRQGVRDPDEWHALTELICPASDIDVERGERVVRFGSPIERYVLVRRLLERLCDERPVLFWLDDVQWGLDALAFARHVLEAQVESPSSVMMVLTAREEALSERPDETASLAELASVPGMSQIEVGPLPADAHAMLVRGLLGLEGGLAAQVEARTGGNPLFAVQLVGDWVHRGILEPGELGFRLRAGARADMPDLLHKVWAARVESVLRGRPAAHGVALEIAAVLGQDVDGAEWRAACAREGVEAQPGLVEALIESRLARTVDRRVDAQWSFVHGMLRESLERRARETGRWWAHHRACAAMLTRRAADGRLAQGSRIAERLGRHLVSAGDLEEALEPLKTGVEGRLATGDYGLASLLLSERDNALQGLNLSSDDPRWGEGWLLHSRLARVRGSLDEALSWSTRALEAARRHRWTEIQARALSGLAAATWQLGQPDRAIQSMREAETQASATGERQLLAEVRRDLANMLRQRGDLASAQEYLRLALLDFERVDAVGEAYCLLSLGEIALRRGAAVEARGFFERALGGFERAGARRGVADCLNSIGESARLNGDLGGAEESYRRSLLRFRAIGSALAIAPECNLGLVLIERGQYVEARRTLESVLQAILREGRAVYRGNVHAYLLPCSAAARDWSSFALHLGQATEILGRLGVVDLDIARMADHAGDLARDAGQKQWSREAYGLALNQWVALGRTEAAARTRAQIELLN